MNQETHIKAIDLSRQIAELQKHKQAVSKRATEDGKAPHPKNNLFAIEIEADFFSNERLLNEFLLLPKEELITLYLQKVQAKIDALQQEFDNL